MVTKAPADLVIRPRDRSFRYGTHDSRWWLGNDPIATAYYNAFSASFPQVERYFIDAVRRYRDLAGPQLRKEMAAFIAQEAVHSREHLSFNRAAICKGYDLSKIDDYMKGTLDWARTRSPLTQVGSAAALEHFTTILAREAIANPRHLESAPAEIRQLWCWHAGEEIEHKSVAFDTFLLASEGMTARRRWLLRCSIMIYSTYLLLDYMLRGVATFFRQDGIASVGTWLRFASFALVTPGVIRRVLIPYFGWYLPGFHPWRHDDRPLIEEAERIIGPSPMPVVS
ncbi:MAG: metal-dependent hydrolase [Rhizomicrobium sp.]